MKGKRLTQTVADDITVDTTFVESALDHLKQKLKDKLGDKFEEVETVFPDTDMSNPFQGLETKYQLECFFSTTF